MSCRLERTVNILTSKEETCQLLLRIEYPGALYHVTSGGNERRDIFLDDHDRRELLVSNI